MSILPLLAASLLVAPQPGPQRIRDTYPTEALRNAQSGAVSLRLWVDPEGNVYRCELLEVWGGEIFGRGICDRYRRIRMLPAKGVDGTPSYGAFDDLVKFTTEGRTSREIQALRSSSDITLSGDGVEDFTVVVSVEADGSVSQCEGNKGTVEDLVVRACTEARRARLAIGSDKDGTAVPYVTLLLVRSSPPSESQ